MKKKVSILCIIICSCLCSCNFDPGMKNGKPRIGVAIYKYDDTFMSYVKGTIIASGSLTSYIETVNSQNSGETQIKQVKDFIASKVKAIAINPVDAETALTITSLTIDANIPLVFFNREPPKEYLEKSNNIFYVGAKAEQAGIIQGEIVLEYLKSHPKADKNNDGIIQYVLLLGEKGHKDTINRSEFSVSTIQKGGYSLELLGKETASWDRPIAKKQMESLYDRFGTSIELIISNNDDMALGCIDYLQGIPHKNDAIMIPIVGCDSTTQALQAIEDDLLIGTVLNDSRNIGLSVFDLSYALALGKKPAESGWEITDNKYIWISYKKVTHDNYKTFQ